MFIIVRHWKYILFFCFFLYINKCLVYAFVTVQIFLYDSRKDCWEKHRENSDLEKVQLSLSCCSKKTDIDSSASVARLIQHWGNLDARPMYVCTPVSLLQIMTTVKRLNTIKKWNEKLVFFGWGVVFLSSAWRIVMPTIFQALGKTATPQPKKKNFSSHFWLFLTVWLLVSFCSLTKGVAQKICRLCVRAKINKEFFFLVLEH